MKRTLFVRSSFVPGSVLLAFAAAAVSGCGGGGGGSGGGVGTASPVTSGSQGGGGAPAPGTGGGPTTPPAGGGAPIQNSGARLGMNLHFFTYYTPDWPFVDVMRSGQTKDGGLGWDLLNPKGLPAPALDENGWPRGLGDGQVVQTLMARGTGGRYPGGVYTLLFEGSGEVQVGMDAESGRFTNDGAGTASHQVTVTPTGNGIQVRITRSSAANPVRNVRLIMPGFETTHAQQPFHPLFLERLRPFAVLRYMDWGRTNHSPVVSWSDRTPPGWRSQSPLRGVAWEHMIALSNTLAREPWLCIPHKANDDYVRKLATLVRDTLDPRLKVYIEYSNEVWNGAFGQHRDVAAAASRAGRTWMAQYAARSVECFRIFEEVLGGTSRLVRVVGSHTANPWVGKQIVAALPAGAADALAVAPYFGGSLGNSKNAGSTRNLSVEQILDACAQDIEKQREHVRANKATASAAGLRLIGYEGGQHLAGVGSAANDATLTAKFVAANRHPRMKALYAAYLAMWKEEVNDLLCAYAFTYAPGKWGSWGALEYLSQTGAPKYDALVDTAAQWHGGGN